MIRHIAHVKGDLMTNDCRIISALVMVYSSDALRPSEARPGCTIPSEPNVRGHPLDFGRRKRSVSLIRRPKPYRNIKIAKDRLISMSVKNKRTHHRDRCQCIPQGGLDESVVQPARIAGKGHIL